MGTATVLSAVPVARHRMAVWTGSENVFVWGGAVAPLPRFLNIGGKYGREYVDRQRGPCHGTTYRAERLTQQCWSHTEMIGAGWQWRRQHWWEHTIQTQIAGVQLPAQRVLPLLDSPLQQCWTGSKIIVWGGNDNITYFNTGGSYDPGTNSW